jgi:hypothetical protein
MTLDKYLTIAECLPQEPKSDVLDKIRAEIEQAAEVEPQESEVHDDD